MLEQHQSAGDRLGVVPAALALGQTARPATPAADGDGCRHQWIQPAPELKFYEPVEVIHM